MSCFPAPAPAPRAAANLLSSPKFAIARPEESGLYSLCRPGLARALAERQSACSLEPVLLRLVQKVNENEITSSKDIRKLRLVRRDPVAEQKFVDGHKLDTVLEAVAPQEQIQKGTLAGDIQQLTAALKRHSWTTLMDSRGDSRLIEKVDEAEKLLRELKKALG